MFRDYTGISKKQLKRAKPENVRRLAKFLRLYIEGMSDGQVIRLVWWRLTRNVESPGVHFPFKR